MTLSAPPLLPSYGAGFNRFAQWPHLKFLVAPFLGPTGLTLYDQALGKHHGALTNMTVSDWETCQYGAFLNVDGVNDRIDHPNVQSNVGPQTMMCWIRPDDITHRGYLLCMETGGAFSSIFGTMTGHAVGNLEVILEHAGANLQARTGTVLTRFDWQQITITYDGGAVAASGVQFYRNGIVQAHANDVNGTLGFTAATGGWIIGGRTADNLRNFEGGILLMSWWDYVMPVAEIFKHFQDPHLLLREVE